MTDETIVCTCLDIKRGTIAEAIRTHQLTTVEQVGEITQAGTICGQCQDDIQAILDELNSAEAN
jgi:NAD(P)H-nitrite reductase large subunit